MKNKILKVFLTLFLFILIGVRVNAEDTKTYACDYDYNGIKFRIKLNNIPASYLKESSSVRNLKEKEANSYFSFGFYNGSTYTVSSSNTTENFYGSSKSIKQLVVLQDTREQKDYLITFASSGTITCPVLYKYNHTSLKYYKDTTYLFGVDSTYTDSPDGTYQITLDNTSIGNGSIVCYDSSGNTVTCDDSQTSLYSDSQLECEYQNDALVAKNNKFKLIYDSSTGKVTYNNEGSGFDVKFLDESDLVSIFASAYANKSCPAKVKCAINKPTLVIASTKYSSDSFDIANGASSLSFSSKCGILTNNNGTAISSGDSSGSGIIHETNEFNIDTGGSISCQELAGENILKVMKVLVQGVRIIGALIVLINGSIKLIPVLISKNADELKKVSKTLILMAIILVLLLLLPSVVLAIGHLFEFDTSCLDAIF